MRLVTEQERTIADSAKRLGISTWAMSRWVKAEKREGADAFNGHGRRTPLGQENFEWRQRVKQLKEGRHPKRPRRTLPKTSGKVRLQARPPEGVPHSRDVPRA